MKKLMLLIIMLLISSNAWAFASRPPQCVTYAKAIEFREYQNRCDELAIQKSVAAGANEQAMRDAYALGIAQRNGLITFYKTQDPTTIAQSCVYAFPNYDYTKDCKL